MGDPLFITLLDNRFDDLAQSIEVKDDKHCKILQNFSGRSLKDFVASGVHVISYMNDDSGNDKSEDLSVFSLYHKSNDCMTYINTHNCMGVLRMKDIESGHWVLMQIKSRFDADDKQYFLTYLLSKVFGGTFVDEIPSDSDSLWDMLLAFMFRKYLMHACEIGLFKQYQAFEHNALRYRGKFNMDEQIKRNIPFMGKIAYTTRDIIFDNPTNHLIRHAITNINKKWGEILSENMELNSLCQLIEQNTPTYKSADLMRCVQAKENLSPIRHPYFASYYEPLRKLSYSILRDEGASLYDSSDNEVDGVLFDGAWLWEEYLNTLLNSLDFNHPRNKDREGRLTVFKNRLTPFCYPDFYSNNIVLDAKYKRIGSCATSTDSLQLNGDLKSLVMYMFLRKAEIGGFLYPFEGDGITKIDQEGVLNGYGGQIYKIGFSVPKNIASADKFYKAIKLSEGDFCEKIKVMAANGVTAPYR